jgi:histidyl-tRNA synthetase
MQGKALPGFRDFYPDDLALRNHIFATWRSIARRYGFEEYDGPPLEPLELYTQKSGAEIVGQVYTFRDRGDREVALRPEMTPTLARMVGARAQGLKKPIRWFSIPQLFRYERQQRGRLREHFQLNMDLIGEPGPLADAELIAAAIDIMRAFGFGPHEVRVRVSDRRVLRALLLAHGLTEAQLGAGYTAIDRAERVPREALAEVLSREGLSEAAIEAVFRVAAVRGRTALEGALGAAGQAEEAAEGLLRACTSLEAMGLGEFVEIDLGIVRGLAYYTGVVFELFDAAGALRAICGGGRYDGLLKALSGVDLPALGFGMGDVVLGELLRDRGKLPAARGGLDAFLIAVGSPDEQPMLRLAHDLRDQGVAVEYGLRPHAVRKQFELASARGTRFAVVVGERERSGGAVLVRNLADGQERPVRVEELAGFLRGSDG